MQALSSILKNMNAATILGIYLGLFILDFLLDWILDILNLNATLKARSCDSRAVFRSD